MTLDQLKILVAIADEGSFSAAARHLRYAQSAISKTIRNIEEEHGLQLFDRTGRLPTITREGATLIAQARNILEQARKFERTARELRAGMEPELRIAVDPFLPNGPLMKVLDRFRAVYPDLPVTLYDEGLGGAERRVNDGTAELGLCVVRPSDAHRYRVHALTEVELVPVASRHHPLAVEVRDLDRETLADHVQLVLTDPIGSTGPSFGVFSRRLWRFVNPTRRAEFLVAGFGWGMAPRHLIAHFLESGDLVQLSLEDASVAPTNLPVRIIHLADNPLGHAARWLVTSLQEADWHSK